jgi:hypothetical protein
MIKGRLWGLATTRREVKFLPWGPEAVLLWPFNEGVRGGPPYLIPGKRALFWVK